MNWFTLKNEAYPIQVKYSIKPRVLYRTQKFQLVMEALLIEEQIGYKIPYGLIKFLRGSQVALVINLNFSSASVCIGAILG